MPDVVTLPHFRTSLRKGCGMIAAVGAALAVIIGLFRPASFFHAYLFAALACINPTLGCLLLAFIHRMTGGAWGRAIAPALAVGQRMLPLTLLFFVPLFFGLPHLFPWASPTTLSLQGRVFLSRHPDWFTLPALILRAICYAILFLVLLAMARRLSRSPWTGPVGMIIYIVANYLLSVDWILSLEPGWTSTGFPVVFMASQAVSALAFCIAVTILNDNAVPFPDSDAVWKDLGNLLLGILMFWAYVAYAQFLVVWSGNLPREAAWYLHRNAGGWHYLLIALAVFQLLIPLLLLLSSRTKRRTRHFAALATGIFLCQILYTYWLILPSFRPNGIGLHWLDALMLLALGGFWLFHFLGLTSIPLQEQAYVA